MRDIKAKFVLFYCTIGIVESLPLNQMCSCLYVVRFLLPSTGQQVHFQCIWISQPFCSSFAPVTHVTSLTGYAANEFLMSRRERKEWSDAFRSRRGSQKLANPGWWFRNIRDERRTWIHDAFWKPPDSVPSSCVFITGHECLQCTGTHTLLSPFCHPADNRDVNQIFSLNIFKEKKKSNVWFKFILAVFYDSKKKKKTRSKLPHQEFMTLSLNHAASFFSSKNISLEFLMHCYIHTLTQRLIHFTIRTF